MPRHWAPCLKVPGAKVLLAEETIYPDFEMKIPEVLTQDDLQWLKSFQGVGAWQHHIAFSTDTSEHRIDYALFTTNHGQNWVFGNARYVDDPHPDGWDETSSMCIGHRTRIKQFVETPAAEYDEVHEEMSFYNGPDPHRFQHHIDHNTKLIAHNAHLVSMDTDILATKRTRPEPVVEEMWKWWPHINHSRISFAHQRDHWAKRLLVPCRAPLVHPYVLQLYQHYTLGPEASNVPLEQRKLVVLMSRTLNGSSRRIVNEQNLIQALNETLQRRGLKEELVVMSATPEGDGKYREFALWVNRNVRAMIGVHGGMLENLHWLSRHSTVLEIVPKQYWSSLFWMDAGCLELQYSMLPTNSTPPNHDVTVDVGALIALLERTLGQEPPQPILRQHYEWIEALEMAGYPVS